MSALTLATVRLSELPIVGLCHSVQGTSRQIAGYLDVPYEELKVGLRWNQPHGLVYHARVQG